MDSLLSTKISFDLPYQETAAHTIILGEYLDFSLTGCSSPTSMYRYCGFGSSNRTVSSGNKTLFQYSGSLASLANSSRCLMSCSELGLLLLFDTRKHLWDN